MFFVGQDFNLLATSVIAGHGVALLLGRRPLRPWMLSSAAAGCLFLPWLLYTRTAQATLLTNPGWRSLALRFGAKLLVYLFLGETSLRALLLRAWFVSLPAIVLLGVAAWGLLRRERSPARDAGWLAAASVVTYLAGIAGVCLTLRTMIGEPSD